MINGGVYLKLLSDWLSVCLWINDSIKIKLFCYEVVTCFIGLFKGSWLFNLLLHVDL